MTNDIEKTLELNAPQARVWAAITDHVQFGEWFGVRLDAPFVAGEESTGAMSFNGNDFLWTAWVDRIEPMSLFSFRWRPYAIKPGIDYSKEEPTLVTFLLEPIPSGTRLTITETGFDQVPEWRRAEALQMNDRGWGIQIERIKTYVGG